MWNDTETPLAYLITFKCYGTWLHGDERGSVNRYRNKFGTKRLPMDESWQILNSAKLKSEPVKLNTEQRSCVERAIRDTCRIRNWALYALNVRTNHVHAVTVAGSARPGIVLNAFKANATREMRSSGCWTFEHSPWADRGSKRLLWNERSIEAAVDYVVNGQGDELPKFL